MPVGSPPPLPELVDRLDLRSLVRAGGLDAERFEPWLADVLAHSVRLHHPAQIAHQVGSPDVPSAIADLIHGAINQPMSIYEMGPAAHAMERVVVEWMTEKLGWPEGSGGVLTHGGSLANFTVLLAARAAAAPDAWVDGVDGTLAVLAPPSTHYSVQAQRRHARARRARGRGPGGGRGGADRPGCAGRRPRTLPRRRAPPDGARGRVVRHEHRAARRPRGDRRVLPRARHLVPRGRRARCAGAALAGAQGPPARDRACRLRDLGRPQDDADAGARRRGAPARGVAARGGLQAEGRVPDLRGLRGRGAEPPRAPGRVHQGADGHEDLHEPGLPRRGRHRRAMWPTGTTGRSASGS